MGHRSQGWVSLPLAFYYCDSLIFNVTERGCLKDYYITRLVIFLIFKENLAITLWNQCRFFSASRSCWNLLWPVSVDVGRLHAFPVTVSVCQLSWVLLTWFPPLPKSSPHLSSCLSSLICYGQSKQQHFGLFHKEALLIVSRSKLAVFST